MPSRRKTENLLPVMSIEELKTSIQSVLIDLDNMRMDNKTELDDEWEELLNEIDTLLVMSRDVLKRISDVYIHFHE